MSTMNKLLLEIREMDKLLRELEDSVRAVQLLRERITEFFLIVCDVSPQKNS